MGFAITWCAVREKNAATFLRELALSPTGETGSIPEALISMARLDTGWQVIWYNEYECPFLQDKELSALSADKEVLLCKVEEHCMASSAELWSGGKRTWWLSHEGEDGPRGIEADGDLPECYPDIRKEMEAAQQAAGGDDADVDHLFEIPLCVAKSLVGFKHDENYEHVIDEQFIVLARAPQSRGDGERSLFHKLFGR